MIIRLNESQFNKLMISEIFSNHGYNINRVDSANKSLETFLFYNGVKMINLKNSREYLVYELNALSNLIGRRYGLVQLIKDGEPYDAVYVKPMELYKRKY